MVKLIDSLEQRGLRRARAQPARTAAPTRCTPPPPGREALTEMLPPMAARRGGADREHLEPRERERLNALLRPLIAAAAAAARRPHSGSCSPRPTTASTSARTRSSSRSASRSAIRRAHARWPDGAPSQRELADRLQREHAGRGRDGRRARGERAGRAPARPGRPAPQRAARHGGRPRRAGARYRRACSAANEELTRPIGEDGDRELRIAAAEAAGLPDPGRMIRVGRRCCSPCGYA